MQWIIQNKEWLFSGLGIPAIVGLITLILLILGLRRMKFKVKVDATITNDKNSTLS